LEADYVIDQSAGKANVLVLKSDDAIMTGGIVATIQKVFSDFASASGVENKVTVVNIPVADWATKIQSEVQTALVRDPSINWVIPIYDSMSVFAAPGIVAAGKTDQVHIATFNGTLAIVKMIEDAKVVSADVSEDPAWLGHVYMDQCMRILAGEAPIVRSGGPLPDALRIIDRSNVAETGTPPVVDQGFGDYTAKFDQLWGLPQ
jgi:ribose transport system substrate-binding protein